MSLPLLLGGALSACNLAKLENEVRNAVHDDEHLDFPGRRLLRGQYAYFAQQFGADSGAVVAAVAGPADARYVDVTAAANLSHDDLSADVAPSCRIEGFSELYLANRAEGKFLLLTLTNGSHEGYAKLGFYDLNCEPLREPIEDVHVETLVGLRFGKLIEDQVVENSFLLWTREGELLWLDPLLELSERAHGVSDLQLLSIPQQANLLYTIEDGVATWRHSDATEPVQFSPTPDSAGDAAFDPVVRMDLSSGSPESVMYFTQSGMARASAIGNFGRVCSASARRPAWPGLYPYRASCDEEGVRLAFWDAHYEDAGGDALVLTDTGTVTLHLNGVAGAVLEAWLERASPTDPWHVFVIASEDPALLADTSAQVPRRWGWSVNDPAPEMGTLYHAELPAELERVSGSSTPLIEQAHLELAAEVVASNASGRGPLLFNRVGDVGDWMKISFDDAKKLQIAEVLPGYVRSERYFNGGDDYAILAGDDGHGAKLWRYASVDDIEEILDEVAWPSLRDSSSLFERRTDGYLLLRHAQGQVADLQFWAMDPKQKGFAAGGELRSIDSNVRKGSLLTGDAFSVLYSKGSATDAAQDEAALWSYLFEADAKYKVADHVSQVENDGWYGGVYYLISSGDDAGVWFARKH